MLHSIFKTQLEKKDKIKEILDKYRHTEEWKKSRNAFGQIIRKYLHGDLSSMKDKELDQHFERALVITKKDVEKYQHWINDLLANKKDIGSPYYLVNTAHHRKDQYFATDEKIPITGTGNQTLNAKFDAQNIYQKSLINAASEMPERVAKSPFPTWDSIKEIMTDKTKFKTRFDITDPDQEKEVFDLVSAWDWDQVQGEVFLTPKMAFNQVFSPALFAVYFFGPKEGAAKNVFFIVSASGSSVPETPFVGIVNAPSCPKQKVYSSVSRFAFTYLSSPDNPMKYWIDLNEGEQAGFHMGIETYYPKRPNSAYIEVITEFCAQVPEKDLKFYEDIPFLVIFLMLIKGTLMRDLVKAYYPNSSSAQLWIDVGALHKGHPIRNDLAAIGLDTLASIFDLIVWKEKPTVSN